jgi:hypothetical protein
MAKNYSITEMVNVLVEGKDLEAIADMGKRFPVLTYKITKVTSKAAEEFADLAKYLDFVSANRVTKLIKGDSVDEDETVVESEVDADAEDETEDEPEKKELTKAEKAKARREARKAKKAKEAAEAAEADESDEDGDGEKDYSDMTAIELFKECKKRKIKAAVPKKPQAFYIDLLKKDDAKKAKAVAAESEDEDDWDAEEEQEKPVAKKARRPKATVKKAKAPVPEVEAEDDDEDDDWDI